MAKTSFQKIQYDFTAHLRNPNNNPAPAGIEDRRIKIYRDLVYNNIEGFLSGGFPVIRSIYTDENWHKMVRGFVADHQSHSPYFLEISQEFLKYLQDEHQTQEYDPECLLELAHYEWVELALMVSDKTIDMNLIDANGNLLEQHPVLSPVAWPLAYEYPVHKISSENSSAKNSAQKTFLVVYRTRNDEVKFMEINPVTARLINLLQENVNYSGKKAIENIIEEMEHPNPDVVYKGGLDALQMLQSVGIILGTSSIN